MRAALWLNALRVVRPRQAAARIARPVRRRRFPAGPRRRPRPLTENGALWQSKTFAPLGARPEPGSRLATFHAHYGEDVLEAARQGGDAAAAARAWAAAHPPRDDDAWHPYVASTRAANWIAAASLEPRVYEVVSDSLRRALGRVAANVENETLGNHLIRNAKALILGGVAFDDAALRRQGEALLGRELAEQVLSDGGHYERSPAYHRLVLRDLLEVRPYVDVENAVERMTVFAAASSRPDGAPALFNDGGLDVAPQLELPPPRRGVSVFEETGYVFVNDGDLWLAFDCGPPSPPFLPAHAHADGLSIQLWWRGRRVVVDPGTSTYQPGPKRDWERSTRAHSTVAIRGRDQFRSWGAFRAGPLPEVRLESVGDALLVASVRWRDGAVHRREVTWASACVQLVDLVTAVPATAAVLVASGVDIDVQLAGGELAFRKTTFAERFADQQPARAAVAAVERESTWTIVL